MTEPELSRWAVARRLLLAFVICWLAMAIYGLGVLLSSAIPAGEWVRLMASMPVIALQAAMSSPASWGAEIFLWCFGLLPWLLAAVAIWRNGAPRWRRICYVVFVLWWLGLVLMGGTN